MSKTITSCELAKLCGVSQGTVDRALNNRPGINPATKEKVLKAAEKYGYFPNIHAGKLAGGKSRLIGVVVFDLRNEYFSELVCSIDNYCRKLGYASITMFSGKNKASEMNCIRHLASIGVDGLIVCPVNKSDAYAEFDKANIPIVTIGNRLDGIPYCGIDDFNAMKALTYRANSDGFSLVYYSPALASNSDDNFTAQELRRNGFCKAVSELNVPYVICTESDELESAVNGMAESAPVSVICSTDFYALKVFSKYPNLPLYSFDSTKILSMINKQTVSVGVNADTVAENAVRILLDKHTDDRVIDYVIS